MNRPPSRSTRCILLSACVTLAGCWGSGGAPPPAKVDTSSLPTVSVSGSFASLPPNTGGTPGKAGDVSIGIKFKVTLSRQPNGVATVGYTAQDGVGGNGAKGGIDYTKTVKEGNTLTFQPGETSKIVDISIIGGGGRQGSRHPYTTPTDKVFYLVLQNPSANITLGTAKAMGTIMYAPGLNDTGIVACATTADKALPCASAAAGTDQYPVQDAQFGRDVIAGAGLLNKIGNGAAAFDFTRITILGSPEDNQTLPYATRQWYCIRDDVTGLIWEVKIPDSTTDYPMHHAGNTYSWYKRANTSNKPNYGISDSGTCTGSGCDTDAYVAAVNQAGYCGWSRWRLPTVAELQSLVHYGKSSGPTVDTNQFPFTESGRYWAASRTADPAGGRAWTVDFSDGSVTPQDDGTPAYVRLVYTPP